MFTHLLPWYLFNDQNVSASATEGVGLLRVAGDTVQSTVQYIMCALPSAPDSWDDPSTA